MLRDIYALQRLTSTRISKELAVDVRSVMALFRSLRRAGIYVKPDIDIKSLGIVHQMIIINGYVPIIDKLRSKSINPFIKSVLYIYPKTTILVFKNKICEELPYESYCIESIVRSRPEPRLLFLASRGKYKELLTMKFSDPLMIPLAKKTRLDWVDLEILRITSKTPEIKLRNLASTIGVKVRTILHHISHAESAITGYRVSKISRLMKDSGIIYFIIISCSEPTGICSHVIRHPFVLGCAYTRKKEVVIQVSLPPAVAPRFIVLLKDSLQDCTIEKIYTGSLKSLYVSTEGSRATGEYSSMEGWLSPSIEDLIKKLIAEGVLVKI